MNLTNARGRRAAMMIVISATLAPAFAHEGDVAVGVRNGRIVTGIGDDVSGSAQFDVRVFGAELEFDPGAVFTDEPGYLGPFLDGFAPGAPLAFNIRAALREWNGTDFGTLSAQTMELSLGSFVVSTPATDVLTPGFVLRPDAANDFDEHTFYELSGDVPGIYLLELELTSPGLRTSLPYWIVHNYGRDEVEHDAAIEYVVQNIVPGPTALGSLFAGAAALAGFRRKR